MTDRAAQLLIDLGLDPEDQERWEVVDSALRAEARASVPSGALPSVEALRRILGWPWWQHADVCDHYEPDCQCGFSTLDRVARSAIEPDDTAPNRVPPARSSLSTSSDSRETRLSRSQEADR